jgi:hypothetical protein
VQKIEAVSMRLLHKVHKHETMLIKTVAYLGIFFGGGSTNSVKERGQIERGSGGGSPLVRGSAESANG